METALVGNPPFDNNTVLSAMRRSPVAFSNLVENWKILGSKLGIDLVDLNSLETKMKIDLHRGMIISELLVLWRAQFGREATLKALHDALKACRQGEIAGNIKELYESKQCEISSCPIQGGSQSSGAPIPKQPKPAVGVGMSTASLVKHPSYSMTHQRRGRAIIFAHEFVRNEANRPAARVDSTNLFACLSNLNFDVENHKNWTKKQILAEVDKVSRDDHGSYDCLIICVSSHGGKDKICASDEMYDPQELWNPFADNCHPSLVGKPKLFFIQACRGLEVDAGQIAIQSTTAALGNPQTCLIPTWADFLVAFSTVPDHVCFENAKYGSIFLKSLTEVFNARADKDDLLTMLTIVSGEVAHGFTSWNPDPQLNQKKQVPMIVSTLTGQIRFH